MKGTHSHPLTAQDIPTLVDRVLAKDHHMQMAYAWHPNPGRSTALEVLYVAATGRKQPFSLWRVALDASQSLTSLTNDLPLLGWYEREMHELYGIDFDGHPECFPLILHEGAAQPGLPPMHPDGSDALSFVRQPWQLPAMNHEELQLLPFGPVRAGVCESAQFLYLYAGESILHFHQRLFFKHRGMEKRFEGLSAALGVVLAERVSGVGSVAHALAYCQAVEMACDCVVPQRAQKWRVIFAELERLYNHLHYLGRLCHTTTLKIGEVEGHLLEEKLKHLNAEISGSRFLRSVLQPGGLRREPRLEPLKIALKPLRDAIQQYCDRLMNTNTHIDRLLGTGVLTPQVAVDEGATGPVARASGGSYDFRVDHPYADYAALEFICPTLDEGDAYARMQLRIQEITLSFDLIQQTMQSMILGPIQSDCIVKSKAEGLGWCESARGGLFYAVHFDEAGRLARVKIKSPSFSNWRAFPFTIHGSNMMDYAISEASFGSTIAGCDR